jgi:hypothetical protein
MHFITEVMRTERLSLVGAMANSIIHDLKTRSASSGAAQI